MEFLKKNALKFLSEAEESFTKKDYNMVMFFIEQFFQLSLKYILYKKYGEFPKTHSLKLLFEITRDKELINFYRENLDTLREIELSYIASRYLDVEYSERIAKESLELAKKFKEVLR